MLRPVDEAGGEADPTTTETPFPMAIVTGAGALLQCAK